MPGEPVSSIICLFSLVLQSLRTSSEGRAHDTFSHDRNINNSTGSAGSYGQLTNEYLTSLACTHLRSVGTSMGMSKAKMEPRHMSHWTSL